MNEPDAGGGGWTPLPIIDDNCFACGRENEHGLKMRFFSDGQRVRGRVTVPPHLSGWQRLAHGGVLATIADETMAWAAIHLLKRFILTREMTVSYRKPVPVGMALSATAAPARRVGERDVIMGVSVKDGEGDLCFTAEGKFVLFTEEEFAARGVLGDREIEVIKRLFTP